MTNQECGAEPPDIPPECDPQNHCITYQDSHLSYSDTLLVLCPAPLHTAGKPNAYFIYITMIVLCQAPVGVMRGLALIIRRGSFMPLH